MTDAVFIECVYILNPRTAERARRLAFAMTLLQQGLARREVAQQVRLRYSVHRLNAWRVVDMACDMAGDRKERRDDAR